MVEMPFNLFKKGGSQRSPRNKQPKKALNQVEEGNVTNTEIKKKEIEDKLNTSIDEKNKKIEDLQKKIKESEDALHQKAAECSRLDSELKHTKNRLSKVDAEKHQLEENLGTELTKSRAELAKYEALKLAESDEFSRSRNEVSSLRMQLDEALVALEKIREDTVPRDAYEADCARIKRDADILKKEVTKTLEKFALLQLELANKEQELSDTRVERNQSEAKSTKFESEVSQLRAKCHESEVQVNVLRQQLTETKQKLNKAMEEINSLRASRRDMTLRMSAKHGEINEGEKKNIESLRKQVENLSRHLQDTEKKYRDTISIYRGHLLASITGQLDEDVQQALQEIIKLRGKDDEKIQLSSHAS